MVHIPSDRHRHGLILDFTVAENMVLPDLLTGLRSASEGELDWETIHQEARRLIEGVRCANSKRELAAGSLSGGNQKVIVARELSRKPELIVAAQPTRGLTLAPSSLFTEN